MRDFHVSPAMGSEDNITEEEAPVSQEESPGDKFRRMARLAMTLNEDRSVSGGQ